MGSILDTKPEQLDQAEQRLQTQPARAATRSVLDQPPEDSQGAGFEEDPQGPHSIASGAFHGMRKDGMSGILPGIKGALASQLEAQGDEPIEGTAPAAIPAAALPAAVGKAAEFMNATPVRRAGLGAAQGAYNDPEHPIKGALKGGALSLGLDGLTKMLTTGGDVGMQVAVGRKKFTPGVGETLADEGVVGTRGMMTKQVNNKLASRGQEISDLAGQIPGNPIDAPAIGQGIAQESARPMLVPGAKPSAADMPKLKAIGEFSQDVAGRGMETGEQAASRRMAAGQRSYRGKEDPMQNLLGQMSKKEQVLYSDQLKDAYRDSAPVVVPEAEGLNKIPAADGVGAADPEALAKADNSYGALKRAQAGLDEPVSLPKSLFSIMTSGVNMVPGGSLLTSSLAQALSKAGKLTKLGNNPLIRDAVLNEKKKKE